MMANKYGTEGKDVELMDDDDEDSDHHYIVNRENTVPVREKPEIVDGDSGNHFAKHLEASSSSSRDSTLNDLRQVDTSQVNISSPRTSIHQEAQPASEISQQASASQSFDVSQQAEIQGLPLMLNPPIQVMDRSGGYDPDRIRSSVFAANPSTSKDWSLASNESLFSIHVEDNNSLSRDKFSLDGLGEQEELMLKEWPKSGELTLYSPSFQVQQMDNEERKNDKMESEFGTTGGGEETMTERSTDSKVKKKRAGVTWKFSNLSGPSDGSGKSFAFPILKDGGKNSSSKQYIERYYSASQMKNKSSSTESHCCSRCCCCCCCCYFPSCRSCSRFCKSILCSNCC